MLILLAWKNIWRNKKRSVIILMAIALGLWGGLLAGAFMIGMGESIVNTSIDRDLAHIQIHQQDFPNDKEITHFIPQGTDIMKDVLNTPGITGVSGRTIIIGMAASPSSSFGVKIFGIQPDSEKMVTNLSQNIVQGDYFQTQWRNPIVIGNKLAQRLHLKLHSKVVLSFSGMDGSIVYIACRVVGIFKTESAMFDEMNVFVHQQDLFRVLETDPIIHEIAIRVESSRIIEPVTQTLKNRYPPLLVQTWKEIAPELAFLSVTIESFSYLFVAIILFALLFGITNTMLMSVVERTKELGVLIAVGMNRLKVFTMILMETIFLSITGGGVGILFGALTIRYFSFAGIDLSAFSSGFESFGASSILYPSLPITMYLALTVMVVITANIASVLPAWKAITLNPSQAIRTY